MNKKVFWVKLRRISYFFPVVGAVVGLFLCVTMYRDIKELSEKMGSVDTEADLFDFHERKIVLFTAFVFYQFIFSAATLVFIYNHCVCSS